MITITVDDLARDMAKYLGEVQRGGTIEIQKDGEPLAIVSPAAKRGREFVRRITPLNVEGISLTKEILAEREEGR
jgi:prevent-host-death family protein